MYEFIDTDGGRVTIRSARTLGQLLANGRIQTATQFRLADEPGFRPAGEHPSLLEIASQSGVQFGGRVPAPEAPPPKPSLPKESASAVPDPGVVGAAPVRPRGSVPSTIVRRAAAVVARPPEPLAPPPRVRAGDGTKPLAQGIVVFATLVGATVLGTLAGAAAGGITNSAVVGWLVTVAGASWLARLAGLRLALRTKRFNKTQVGAGSAVFIAGCLLAGWSGVIVGLPACSVLLTTLSERRVTG